MTHDRESIPTAAEFGAVELDAVELDAVAGGLDEMRKAPSTSQDTANTAIKRGIDNANSYI
jgi:hypothetical protein